MDQTFSQAINAWNALSPFRNDRERCKRYVYGDQWDDVIKVGNEYIKEKDFIRQEGQIPMKNNILRRILRNVVGLYRSQYQVPQLSARDTTLKGEQLRDENRRRRVWFQQNHMEELSARLLEEFLISGMVAAKVEGTSILPVTPDNFFFRSDGYDPRGIDIDLIGEVHRVSYGALLQKFCKTADDFRRLTSIYKEAGRGDGIYTITEVWHRETQVIGMLHDEASASLRVGHMADMVERMKKKGGGGVAGIVSTSWRQLWYAEDGTLLRSGEAKERHPYVFKAYPFVDGEVHSYIGDLIDQQRYVNRLITLYDFVMKASAKGVLLVPDDSVSDRMSLQDMAREWSRFNGVITYKARPGMPMPTQVSGNAANIGITDLLKIEMQMLEDISGVSPTLQGKLVTNATSGTLFAQQNEAAQTSLLDILRTFEDFLGMLASYSEK